MLQNFLHQAERFFNPSKYFQDQMIAACKDGDLELIQALLKKGATLRYQEAGINDPAYGVKAFIEYPRNNKFFSDFLDIVGGITPELLTHHKVYHFPLLDWVIKRLNANFEEQQQILDGMVNASTLEALHLLEAQSNAILAQSSDNPFQDLNRTIQLAQFTLELVQVSKEKKLLEKTIRPINNIQISNTLQSPQSIVREPTTHTLPTKRFKI